MLERNNVWEYGEGLLQACISSTRGKRQHSGFKSGCHRRVGGHLTDLKNTANNRSVKFLIGVEVKCLT